MLATAIRSTRAGRTCVNVAIWGHEATVATIELIESGKVDPFQFITGRIGLDDIVTGGFDELVNNKEESAG